MYDGQNLTRAGLSVETEFDSEGAMLFLKIGADGRHSDMMDIGSPTEGLGETRPHEEQRAADFCL